MKYPKTLLKPTFNLGISNSALRLFSKLSIHSLSVFSNVRKSSNSGCTPSHITFPNFNCTGVSLLILENISLTILSVSTNDLDKSIKLESPDLFKLFFHSGILLRVSAKLKISLGDTFP